MPRAKYPKPWQPTGSGSYREERPGVFRLNYRPYGTRGPRKNILVACSEEEARATIASASLQRSRSRAGMPVLLDWAQAKEIYDKRLDARRVRPKYKAQVLDLIESLQALASGIELSEVRAHHVQDWIDARARELQADGYEGWARTANKELDMIRAFFNRLRKQGLMENDPISAVDKFSERTLPTRDLLPEEYAAVWHASEQPVRDLLDFFLMTAARFSEVQKMKHAHVTHDGRWICTDRKGRDYLKLKLSAELLEIVNRQAKRDDGFVFHRWVGRNGEVAGHGFKRGEPIGCEWWNDVIEARCKRVKIPIFQGHDLRHAAASWARAAGCSPWYIQALLKHKDLKTTLRYAHEDVTDGTNVVLKTLSEVRQKALEVING